MYYLGIDIGKKFHETSLVSQEGEIVIAPFRFSNTRAGFNLLREKISAFSVKDCSVGLEATGHY